MKEVRIKDLDILELTALKVIVRGLLEEITRNKLEGVPEKSVICFVQEIKGFLDKIMAEENKSAEEFVKELKETLDMFGEEKTIS